MKALHIFKKAKFVFCFLFIISAAIPSISRANVYANSPYALDPAPTTPTISPNGAISFCVGGNLTASSGISYLWSNGATTQTIYVTTSGSYFVTVDDGSGPAQSAATNVTVTNVTANITALGSTTICSGNSVVLSASGAPGSTYSWSNGETTQTASISNAGSYTVSVTTAGCSGSSYPMSVYVNPLPVMNIVAGSGLTFCQGGTVVLTAGSNSPVTYQWSTGETTQNITATVGGNYTVTGTDVNGCSQASPATTLTVLPLPTVPTISASGPTTFCQGGNVTLTSSSALGYLWDTGETTQSITASNAHGYIVTVSGANGCYSSSVPEVVTILSLPSTVITQSGANSQCLGNSASLSVPAAASYLWSTGETTQSINASSLSGNYTVVVTGTNGCVDTSAPILVSYATTYVNNGVNTHVASGAVLVAPGIVNMSNGTFDNEGLIDINTCHWVNNGGNTGFINNSPGTLQFTGGNQSVQGTSITDFYNLTAKGFGVKNLELDANVSNVLDLTDREVSTDVNTLYVNNSSVSAIIRTSGFVSSVGTGSLSRNTASASTYLYPVGSSVGTTRYRPIDITPVNSNANTYTVRMANVDPTSESYARNMNDGSVCSIDSTFYHRINQTQGSSAADISIYYNSLVDGSYSAIAHWQNVPYWENAGTVSSISNYGLSGLQVSNWTDFSYTPFALGSTSSAQATVSASGSTTFCHGYNVILTSSSGSSYLWSTGETTQSIVVTTTGSYYVTVSNINGCPSSSTSAPVQVIENPLPLVSTTPSGQATLCSGSILTSSAGSSYLWSTGETTQSITLTSSGTYTVTVTDGNGCVDSAPPVFATVNALPVSTISPSGSVTVCQGSTLTASAGSSYLWSTGETTQSIAVNNSANYTVVVTDGNGCSETSSATSVTMDALPGASITSGSPTTACAGGTVVLTASSGSSYLWTNGETDQSITVNTSSGTYGVTVTGANGCTSTSAQVSVNFNTIFVNNGTQVRIMPGVSLLAGGVTNENSGTFDNAGTINITTCHWINNAGNGAFVNASPGTVILTGDTQNIEGSSVTQFYNLTLSGTGVKRQKNSEITENILALNSLELSTDTSTMYVTNSSTSAITRTSGFVSSQDDGGLSRNTLSSSAYLYPVGSQVGTLRYRPIEITPNASSSHMFKVRMANVDAGNEGFSRSVTDGSVCSINADFYHRINRISGSSSADISIFYNPSADGSYSTIAHWQNVPQWENAGTVSSGSNYGLNSYTVSGWNDFSYTPFSLGTTGVTGATITAAGPTTFCIGGSVVLTSSPSNTYLWSTGETTQSITANTTGNYTVSTTASNGCTSTSTPESVTVNSLPVVSFGSLSAVCLNTPSFALSGGTPSGGTYTGTGVSGNNFDASVAGTGSKTLTYTYTDVNGCTASATQTILVKSLPTATISALGATTFCQGGNVTLTASGGSGSTYLWSTGATTKVTTPTASGSYSVTVTVTDANGCSATSTGLSVVVNSRPLAITGANQTICNLQSVALGSAAVAGNTYSWSPSTGLSSSSVSDPTANPSVTTTYTLTETITATGCTNSNPVTVTVNQLPVSTVSASGPTTICLGDSVTLTANLYTSYLWSNGETTRSIKVKTLSGNYSVTVTDANACQKLSAPTTVVVNPLPAAVTGGNQTICVNQSISLGAPSVAGNTYSWSPSNGLSSSTVSDPIASPTTTTTYTLTETIAATGCLKTNTSTVTVNTLPIATITASGPTTFCQGGSITLTSSPGVSYLWNTTETTQSINVSTSGLYTLIVTDANGCNANLASVNVVVKPLPIANVTANGPTTFCQGGNLTLTSSVGSSYLWSNGATTQSINLTSTSGNYSVVVTASNGCTSTSSSVSVTVVPVATPVITALGSTTICSGNSVVLSASGAPGSTYSWSNGETTQTASISNAGSYTVSVTTAGCSGSSYPMSVYVNPLPVMNIVAGSGLTFCQGGTVVLTAGSNSPVTYQWSTGETTQNITATVGGNYTVTGTDVNGCSQASPATTLTVLPLPTVPTISASGPTTFCQGGNVTLTSSSALGYLWDTGETTQSITASNAHGYIVTVSGANGCYSSSVPEVVTILSLPSTVITQSGANSQCLGNSASLSVPAAASYLWSTGETTQSINASSLSGNYTVVVTGTNGCVDTSAPILVSYATTYVNNGVNTHVASGAVLVAPGIVNMSNGTFDNEGLIDINTCHWVNNGGNTGFINNSPGTLQFTGGNQSVQGTSITDFYNLTAKGFGVKNLELDANVSNVLDLTDREVSTDVNTLYVNNSSVSAIIRTSGFVSSVGTGSLSRNTASASTYLYPVGSSVGTTRYRPIDITPVNSNANTYTVRMANVDPTSESYARNMNDGSVCSIDSTFYHRINQTQGSSAADISIYYNSLVDGSYSAIAHWQNVPYWENAGTVSSISNYGLSGLQVSNWTDFSYTPFALGSTSSAQATVSASGSTTFCHGYNVILTSSSGSSYLWSTGETTQSIVVTTTGSYYVTVSNINGCPSSSTSAPVQVIENPLPLVSTTPSGQATLCSGSILTSSAGSSYLWSTGETTQSITLTSSGTYTVTVTDGNGCVDSAPPVFATVNALPVSTISPSGSVTVCQGSTLTASAGSSYLWSTGETTQSIAVNNSANYTVVVTDGNGCSETSSATSVTMDALPGASITSGSPTTACAGGTVVLTASSGSSYLWTNGETDQSITVNTSSGTYGVTVTGANGCTSTSAQVSVNFNTIFVNNGTQVRIMPGVSLLAGGVTNENSGTFDNAGTINITTCHWINNAGNGAFVNASPGTVILTGDTQNIEGSSVTQFYNLTLSGTGVKRQKNSEITENILALNSLELSTDTSTMYVTNSSTSAITRTSGFVSSQDDGGLSRNTLSSSAYLYPVGSQVGTLRYRPIEITPNASSSHMFKVRMANVDAGNEGFSRSVTDGSVCSINADFYHRINRISGSSSADISIFYNPSADGSYSTIAHWQNVPQWENAGTVSSGSNYGLNSYTVSGWNDFSYTPFSLGTTGVTGATITAAGPTTFCIGGSVVLTSSPSNTYLWSTGETTQSITANTTGNYTVSTTASNGCTSTSTPESVTVNSLPVVSFGSLSAVCLNTPSFALSGGTPSGGTYTGTGVSGNNFDASVAGTGSKTLTYTYTDVNGCTASATQTILVKSLPTATISALGATTFCQGGNVTLTASGGSGSTYLWSTGATTKVTTPTASGSYSVTVTVTDANGCSATSTGLSVVVNSRPLAITGANQTICNLQSVALGSAAVAGNTYSWSPSTGLSSSSVSDPTANPSVTTTYTLTETITATGCTNSNPVTVTVNQLPVSTVSASGPTTICLGDSVTLTANLYTSYLWSNGETTRSIKVKTLSGNYSVTVTDANACQKLSAPTTVVVNPLPAAVTGGNQTICVNQSISLGAPSVAGNTYSWSPSNGLSSSTVSDPIASPTTTTTYTLTETIAATGCLKTNTSTVTVNTLPIATITASGLSSFCQGGSVTLTSSIGASYLWSTGETTQSIVVASSGNYTVTVTNALGCSATSSPKVVTVNAYPTASITPSGPTTLCQGGTISLTSSVGFTYLWNNGATTQSISTTTSGSYSVTVTALNGCAATSAVQTITVLPITIPTISASGPTTFCYGNNVTLSSSGQVGSTYSWSTGETTSSITVSATGSYSVTTTTNGCSVSSNPISVTVNQLPITNISQSGPTTFCQGNSVVLTSTPAVSYAWSNGATSQSIQVSNTGNYNVLITDANNCSNYSSITNVTVLSLPVSIITPNRPLTFCQGDSVILTASNGASYLWSTGETTSSIISKNSGQYNVTVTGANGCSTTSVYTYVFVNPLPSTNVTQSGPSVLCATGTVTLTVDPASTYLWNTGETTQSITTNSNSGVFSVTVGDANGCNATSSPISVQFNPVFVKSALI